MALPIGVATVDVTIGVPITFTGKNLATSVTVTPSADLVHTASGTPLVAMLEDLSIGEGVQGVLTLPVTDQDGFQDLAGNGYKNWYYTVTLQYSMKGKTLPSKTKVFQLPAGQGPTIDLDLVPSGNAQLAYIAPSLPVTSVVGKTGAVLGSDIAADPALTSTFESQTHASGTYVPLSQKGAASGVASLDAGARVPDAQLPTRLSDATLSSTFVPAGATSKGLVVRPQGAAANGTTDDTAVIQSAITQAQTLGAWVDLGGKSYAISGGITLSSGARIRNGELVQTGWTTHMVSASGSRGTSQALTADAARQTNLISAPTSGLSVGDYVLIGSTASSQAARPEFKVGEIGRVRQILSSTQFYIWGQTRDAYKVSDAAFIQKLSMVTDVALEGVKLRNSDPGNHAAAGVNLINFSAVSNASLHNVVAIGSDYCGLRMDYSYGITVTGFHAYDQRDNATSYGYGIAVGAATENVTITSSRFTRVRHAVTTDGLANQSGSARGIVVSGCVAYETTLPAFDTHPGCEDVTFVGCVAENCLGGGFQLRGRNNRVLSASVAYCSNGVIITDSGSGSEVKGSNFAYLGGLYSTSSDSLPTTGQEGHGVSVAGAFDVTVTGNTFTALLRPALKLDNSTGNTVKRVTFKDNTIRYVANFGAVYVKSGITDVVDLVIENNHYYATGTSISDPLLVGVPANSFLYADTTTITSLYIKGNDSIGMTGAWIAGTGSTAAGIINTGNMKLDQGDVYADPSILRLAAHNSATIENALNPDLATSNLTLTGGVIYLSCFTPIRNLTVSQLRMATGGTAQAGATLIKMGLFTISGTTATLVAQTASDTTLFNATYTAFTRSLTSSYTLVAGQRYALGVVVVGATTQPSLLGQNLQGTWAFDGVPVCGQRTGQTDLVSGTFTVANYKLGAKAIV